MKLKNTRGYRNNNPGNVVRSNDVWQGEATIQSDKRFIVFQEMSYGVRCLCKLLSNYVRFKGLTNINSIINRYAPASENDTKKYIEFVAEHSNLDKFQNIKAPSDKDSCSVLARLAASIICYENGDLPMYDYWYCYCYITFINLIP